jgi:RNase adapter protein RapZ
VTIAIGCTGGRHRSPTIAAALAERLKGRGVDARVVHRDLGRG